MPQSREDDIAYFRAIQARHSEISESKLAELVSQFIPTIREDIAQFSGVLISERNRISNHVLDHPIHSAPASESIYEGKSLHGYTDNLVRRAAVMRQRLRMTQAEFASRLGLSHRTWQEWEQGRRSPTGAARALLANFLARPIASTT